ncbi:acyl-CoA dehydrogenase family protein [Dactylosporangium sp. NPDC051485]|uniref:acyl-CoA dehydrogenase family protein n=1 Tax=Dactylosporangium sp. NPDC051485 TaxID=3154846 RepID=UPI003415821E
MTSIDLIADPTAPDDPEVDRWTAVAVEVAGILRKDVVDRDRANAEPVAEIALLREHGLLELTVPHAFGGHGAPWRAALQVARIIARADTSIAHILAYHYGWLRIVESFGTDAARDELRQTAAKRWLWASPGTSRLGLPKLIPIDGGHVVTGESGFATGGPVCDRLFTRALHRDTGDLHIVALDPRAPGLAFTGTWDVLGQRLTASRSVTLNDVPVPAHLAAFGPLDQPPAPIWSLAVLNFQLIFSVLHLGTAEGALLEAADYTRQHTRPWFHSLVEQANDEPFILQSYGNHLARVQAVSALTERADAALTRLYALGDQVNADQRAAVAELIAAARVNAIDVGLAVTSGLFDLTGARATSAAHGLDRFWRNQRTLSLHDPVAYKQHELGGYFVNGTRPAPSGYR